MLLFEISLGFLHCYCGFQEGMNIVLLCFIVWTVGLVKIRN